MRKEPDPSLYPLCLIQGILLAQLFRFFPLATLVILFSELVYFLTRLRRASLLLLLILLGLCYASFYHSKGTYNKDLNLNSGKETLITLEILSLPGKTEKGFIHTARPISPAIDTKNCLFFSPSPVSPSSVVLARANLFLLNKRKSPGLLNNSDLTLFIRPIEYRIVDTLKGPYFFPDRLRWSIYREIDRLFSPQVSTLLKAITIGHREAVDSSLYSAFSSVGLSHLLSISGTHFGLFAFMVFTLINSAARLLPYRLLVKVTARYSLKEYVAVLTIPFVLFYLMLSGGRIPALRAFIMTMLFLTGLLWGRETGWKQALVFAATLILFFNPDAYTQPAFQLSFSAVWFIGTAFEWLSSLEWFSKKPGWKKTILKLLAVPLVAFLGTLPLTVFYFHKIPLLSVPMNLIITPIVCFILMPLSILSSLMYLITGLWPFTALTEHLARAVLRIVYSISSFPHIVIPVRALPVALIISVYLFLFALSIRKRSLTVFASILIGLSLVFSTGLYEFKKPMVTFLDVGQGDSAVVETSDNKTIVIDTGNTGRETAAYLSYRGINTIDALVLTHADQDHSGGFYRLIDYFRVKELWDNGELRYSRLPQGIRHRSLLAGTVLKADKSSFQVLHPFRGYYSIKGSERNNHSLVMKFSDEPLSVLFTGDAEEDAEKTMLAYKNLLRARLLKVSHHGSHTATTRAFLSALSPEVAVISVGRHNRYGHPHRDVLIRLAPYRLFRTDLHGSIRIYKKDTNTFSVATYSDMALRDIIPDYSPLEELKNLKRLFLVW